MRVAFFPGKFQPPHIGHIETIMSLYDEYDTIIVGITEDMPQVIRPIEIKNKFSNIFKYLPKFKFEIIKGILTESKSFDHLPNFNVLLSGNEKVIQKAKLLGFKTKFIERSEGIGYSGTEIRSLIN